MTESMEGRSVPFNAVFYNDPLSVGGGRDHGVFIKMEELMSSTVLMEYDFIHCPRFSTTPFSSPHRISLHFISSRRVFVCNSS
ncbi:Hypothetical predicted protein [Octopus vulgaris]|uniref:Uncharacterized protein n=1 Tax=Octopus vulgaris TaxID=6645 RepID=A0AA36FL42_OCTVU|nr:Hypothetical predicted protein [Octopus vulgaris]